MTSGASLPPSSNFLSLPDLIHLSSASLNGGVSLATKQRSLNDDPETFNICDWSAFSISTNARCALQLESADIELYVRSNPISTLTSRRLSVRLAAMYDGVGPFLRFRRDILFHPVPGALSVLMHPRLRRTFCITLSGHTCTFIASVYSLSSIHKVRTQNWLWYRRLINNFSHCQKIIIL